MRCLFLSVVFGFISVNQLFAQFADSALFARLDIAPRWIWRGVSYSNSPVFQPSLGFENNKFCAYVWSSYSFDAHEYSEIDFVIEYKPLPILKMGFTDYFGIANSAKAEQNLFNFNRASTTHLFDLYFEYMPLKRIPIYISWSTWVWGADKDSITGKQSYSSYAEIKFVEQIGQSSLYTMIGATPWQGFYADRTTIVNLGLGVMQPFQLVNRLTFPVKAEFTINPYKACAYLNIVLSLKL